MDIYIIAWAIFVIAVVIVSAVEYKEYRRFVAAAKGMIALKAATQVAFDQMAEHMNDFLTNLNQEAERIDNVEKQLILVDGLLTVHDRALNLNMVRQVNGNINGEVQRT